MLKENTELKQLIRESEEEIEETEKKIEKNNNDIGEKQRKLTLLRSGTTDESWPLLLVCLLSIPLAPYGLITCPLILYRNKKANQFYKWIRWVCLFVILYNLNTLIALVGTRLGWGTVTIE